MSPKDIETTITEILASATPALGRHKPSNSVDRKPSYQPNTFIARPRKRRPRRNPLYTSLRLIILGLVLLLVPLLFSGIRVQPPTPAITGSMGTLAPVPTTISQPVMYLTTSDALNVAPQAAGQLNAARVAFRAPAC
jgi:hypothetical protein